MSTIWGDHHLYSGRDFLHICTMHSKGLRRLALRFILIAIQWMEVMILAMVENIKCNGSRIWVIIGLNSDWNGNDLNADGNVRHHLRGNGNIRKHQQPKRQQKQQKINERRNRKILNSKWRVRNCVKTTENVTERIIRKSYEWRFNFILMAPECQRIRIPSAVVRSFNAILSVSSLLPQHYISTLCMSWNKPTAESSDGIGTSRRTSS